MTKAKAPVDKPAAQMVKIGKDGKIPGLNDNEDVQKIKTWTMWTTTGMGKTGIKNEAE